MTLRLPEEHRADEAGLARCNALLADEAAEELGSRLGTELFDGLRSGDGVVRRARLGDAPALEDLREVVEHALRAGGVEVVAPGAQRAVGTEAELRDALADGWVAGCAADAPALAALGDALATALLAHVRCLLWWHTRSALGPAPGWADFERLYVAVGSGLRVSLSEPDGGVVRGTVALGHGEVVRVPPGVVPALTRLDGEGAVVEYDVRPLREGDDEVARRAELSPGLGGLLVDDHPAGRRVVAGDLRLGTLGSVVSETAGAPGRIRSLLARAVDEESLDG